MDESRILRVVADTEDALGGYLSILNDSTSFVRPAVRSACAPLRDGVELRIASCEVQLIRHAAYLVEKAEFHIIKAYYYASPGLIAFIIAMAGVVTMIIKTVNIINTFLQVITGQNLAYWLDKLIPGFAAAWNNLMNNISALSGALGWGVDGVHHLLNVAKTSADIWGSFTGRGMDAINTERYARLDTLMNSYSRELVLWQSNPGQQIAKFEAQMAGRTLTWTSDIMSGINDKLSKLGTFAEKSLKDAGTITSELLAIRNDMPAFIAQHIPQGLWDGIGRVDTTINDRILPALITITDRIEELDAVLESHRKKAEELSARLAHPGDLLAEIDKLPAYARSAQLIKIDSVTSALLEEQNEASFAALEGDLREFARVSEALSHPPAPLSFMLLELPGHSYGIISEPRETWFVGDF